MDAHMKLTRPRTEDSRQQTNKPHPTHALTWEWRFALFLTLAFGIVCLLTLLRHEMWRDEIEVFVMARDSATLGDLFRSAKLSGHPGLWHLLVYALTRVTHRPVAMQLLNFSLVLVAVLIFSRFAPFSRWLRVLFAFGYFPLYEYGAISREYALAMLLVFVLCAVYQRRPQAIIPIAALLILMALATVYTFILAIAFVLALVGRFLWDESYRSALLARPMRNGLAAFAVLAAMVVLIFVLRPPTGGRVYHGLNTEVSGAQVERILDEVWNPYLPLPKFQKEFWNTNIVTDTVGSQPFLDLLLLAGAIYLLFPNRFALSWYLIGTAGIFLFSALVYFGFLRHHGFLFILLLASLWILNADPTKFLPEAVRSSPHKRKGSRHRQPLTLEKRRRTRLKFQNAALGVVLTVHCAAGAFACVTDWIYPFSCSRLAANYILEHHLNTDQIVGRVDLRCFSITAWTEHQIYFADSLSYGSFLPYEKPATFVTNESAATITQILANESGKDVVLVLTDDPPHPSPAGFAEANAGRWNIRELTHCTDSIVPDEHFWIFVVKPALPNPNAG
jgi:hypothetical protein